MKNYQTSSEVKYNFLNLSSPGLDVTFLNLFELAHPSTTQHLFELAHPSTTQHKLYFTSFSSRNSPSTSQHIPYLSANTSRYLLKNSKNKNGIYTMYIYIPLILILILIYKTYLFGMNYSMFKGLFK